MDTGRKYYLDNIRSITVILVMVYHAAYIFNGVGVLGGFSGSPGHPITDGIITLINPWFMVLLFCIAGIAARYSVNKRGRWTFIKERTNKLLVPSTLGLLIIHWITGYFNIKIGMGLETIPAFLIYPIAALSGTGQLWFAQLLYVYSLSCLFLTKFHSSKFDKFLEKSNSIVILLFGFIIWCAAQILNMPIISVYRMGIYYAAFLIGYFVLYHDSVMARIEKMLPITTSLAICSSVIYMVTYYGGNYASEEVLKSFITNFYLWTSVLAILGAGRKLLNFSNAFFEYMKKNSFGMYVLHYLPLIAVGYVIENYTDLACIYKILIVLVADLILTPILNFVISKIPLIRYFVLGIKGGKNEIQIDHRS